MTVNRFVKGTPKATVSEPVELNSPKLCEIPGCKSLYLGKDRFGDEHHAVGKGFMQVDDGRGEMRWICPEHYLRGVVQAGKAQHQDLVDHLGAIDPEKFRAMQRRLRAQNVDFIPHDRVSP